MKSCKVYDQHHCLWNLKLAQRQTAVAHHGRVVAMSEHSVQQRAQDLAFHAQVEVALDRF